MNRKKMLKCITSEDEECILMNLICGKNLHQLMICLNTGYCITPRVLQFMVELGWTKEVKAFLEKSSFDYFENDEKRLAEWIIAFLDEEAAYALFKRCHWDNNFLCCISNECFIRHQDWDCCFKYKRWEVLIEQGQFGWIPMEENVSEWGPMLAQRGCFEVLYSRNQLSFIAEYGKKDDALKFLADKGEWQAIYLHAKVLFGSEDELWPYLYKQGVVKYMYGFYGGKKFLIQNKAFDLFVQNKNWKYLSEAHADASLIDWEDFYKQDAERCIKYATAYRLKGFLRRKGYWFRALIC